MTKLFDNTQFGDIFYTTENKRAVFLRFAENSEYNFAILYVEGWGTIQVFRGNGKEVRGEVAYDIIGKRKPSLPSNLDEAANNYGIDIRLGYPRVMDETDRYIYNAFKAGSEWMAGQGCNIDSYQKQARTFLLEKFQNMPMFELVKYCTLGLNEEAGEVAGKIKKSIRDADGEIDEGRIDAIVKEMGDVLWYLAIMAYSLGLPLSHIAKKNIEKLSDRMNRGKIRGEGDER